MEEEVGRSARIRRKPLQFWNNERVRYNIRGDIIEGSFSESSSQLHSSSSHRPTKNNSACPYKKKNNVTLKSKRNKLNKTLPNNYKEKITILEVGKVKTSSKNRGSVSNSAEVHQLEKETQSLDNSENRYKNGNRESNDLSAKNDAKKKIVEQTDEQELPHCNNILTLELPKRKDVTVFQLTSMTEMRNEYDELFYLERGPCDVNVGLCTGFVCLKSPTLHWGYCSAPRKIFTMEGEGSIEFTHESGAKDKRPLFKGAKYDIGGGGDILLTKEENCPHLFLFVSFISSDPKHPEELAVL